MSIQNPRDVPEAQAIISRLCELQAQVVREVLGHDDPADCFCGESGYWPLKGPGYFRNAGKAVDFIVEATLAAIAERRSA